MLFHFRPFRRVKDRQIYRRVCEQQRRRALLRCNEKHRSRLNSRAQSDSLIVSVAWRAFLSGGASRRNESAGERPVSRGESFLRTHLRVCEDRLLSRGRTVSL